MNPEHTTPGVAKIWIDHESNLPALVRYEGIKGLGCSIIQVDKDIQWNIDLDPNLFDATPPKGYTDTTPKPPTLEEEVHQVRQALKIYAEASGGHYPEKIHPLKTTEDLCRMLGLARLPRGEKQGNAGKAAEAMKGFVRIHEIHVYNSDPAYYGDTVGPKDNDKVLLRWTLDDGKYEVIFGDLHSETVTADPLRALEGKSARPWRW